MEIKLMFFTLLGLFVLVLIINLLRTYRMEVKYSLLWLAMGIIIFLTPILYPFWSLWADKLNLADPNLVIIVMGMIGLTFLCLQFTILLSKAKQERKILAQRLSILTQRIQQFEKKLSG